MTIYFNNDQQGIVIDYYHHSYRFEEEEGHFNEIYNINVDLNESPASIAHTYENVPITKIVIKNNNNEVVRTSENLNLKITSVDESINETS